ncbi:hypothetical protein AALC17_11820 [Oscillospiraceae bacterium 38-13]
MKKQGWMILCLCGLLCLTGCGTPAPNTAADGSAWDESWVTIGNVIGVETPEGMTFRENSDALSAKGMYYATWSIGDAAPIVNEDGEDAQIYDAQVYLLLAGYDDTSKAEDTMKEWLDMAYGQYAVDAEAVETCNGQEFTVIIYTYTSETNPYAYGASAYGAYGNYAVSVELSCQENFDGSALEILADFLEHCHYAA